MQSLSALQRPASASSRFYTLCAQVLQPSFRRHQSSYRRTRSKLNIKPDASFLPSQTEVHDHIIFNPPPSMPNIYHTPNIFLPKNDRRKQLTTQSAPVSTKPQLERKQPLTMKEVEEMRALRKMDPVENSVGKLAKRYACSTYFVVAMTHGLAPQMIEMQKAVTGYVKSRWGKRKRVARENRQLRKEHWFRDD